MNGNKDKTIAVIGAALDKGASRHGCANGPQSICDAGLLGALSELGYSVHDSGDITVSEADYTDSTNPRLKNLNAVNAVNTRLYASVLSVLEEGFFPVVLGGDHSLATGSVSAVQKHYGKIGLIWVDAHGDYNSDGTTPSGNIHGMPLSALTGRGPAEILPFRDKSVAFVDTKNTVIIAARDLDIQERIRLKEAGVTVFTMADIDRLGIQEVAARAISIAAQGTAGVYVSFDLDATDPSVAPGVGTPVPGGLTYREARVLCESLAASDKLLGLEMVELNPLLDEDNRSARTAVDMVSTLLGKTLI